MILAVLQARSSSSRLPGKVLADLGGMPMILRQIERIRRSALIDMIVVATSIDPSDDELAAILEASGVAVRRGPLDDVIGRFEQVVREYRPSTIVRLTADCPLADPGVIDRVVGDHLAAQSDYSSNTLRPSYPDGLDVECVSADAFERLSALPLTAREREHVTLGLYSRADLFALHSVEQTPNRSDLRWTVDVADDLAFVREVFARLYDEDPGFDQNDVLALLAENPALNRTERDVARNAGSRE